VVCFSAAGGLAYVYKQTGDVPRVSLGGSLSDRSASSEPQNFLIVGVDDDTGLDPNDPVMRGRQQTLNTDTIMILRVDPSTEKASLLSLPRDLWVTIPGTGSKQRINTAMALGGPNKLIETIQQDFGIPIHHYVQVNFHGFRELVQAVDGVPIYFPWPARDQQTGFFQYEPGCVTLDGEQALAYARSRHFEVDDGKGWHEDPSSDFGRISRQQQFIKAALKRAVAKGVRNPFTLNQLLGVAQSNVTLDERLTNQDLVDLGSQFRDFDPDRLDVYTPPATGGWAGAAAVLFLNEREAQPIFDIFRGIDSSLDPSAAVRLEVRNGSGTPGQGRRILNDLGAKGFGTVRSSDATDFGAARTVIKYAPGQEKQAVAVARYLDVDPSFELDSGLPGDVSVALVTGPDLTGVRAEPRPAEDFQAFLDSATTTTAPATREAPGGATTSTTLGDVPASPPGVACG